MENTANRVELQGVLAGGPAYSHSARGEAYYTFPIAVLRLSGTADTINVIARQTLLESTEIQSGTHVYVCGELRSFNNKSGQGNKLVITVFARELEIRNGEDKNSVCLTGTLCKTPNLRRTPMGREICDLMLAVNRHYGRSDYLPCIAWGRLAEEASFWDVGTRIQLMGRIQSRKYIKTENEIPLEKTAFEVSILEMQEISEE